MWIDNRQRSRYEPVSCSLQSRHGKVEQVDELCNWIDVRWITLGTEKARHSLAIQNFDAWTNSKVFSAISVHKNTLPINYNREGKGRREGKVSFG